MSEILQKEWKTLAYDKTTPTLLHLNTHPVQKNKIQYFKCFVFFFFKKKPQQPPFIYISE